MAPKKPLYNSALSREEEARRRLLENSGGEFDFSEEEAEPLVAERVQRFPEIDLTERIQEFPEIDISRPLIQAPEMDLTERVQRFPEIDLTERVQEFPEIDISRPVVQAPEMDLRARNERLAKAVKAKTQPIEDPTLRSMVEGVSAIAERASKSPDEFIATSTVTGPAKTKEEIDRANTFNEIATNFVKRAEALPESSPERASMEMRLATVKALQGDSEQAKNIFRDVLTKAPQTQLPSNNPRAVKLFKEITDELGIQANVAPTREPSAAMVSEQVPAVPPALPEAVDAALVPAQTTAAPATEPPAPTPAASPEQSRLAQLAAILQSAGGAGGAQEPDARQQAVLEALGKAQQAMYAGLTRAGLPATFFAQTTPARTQEDQLSRLYKAAQIQQMLTPKGAELASDAAKQFLAKNAPELLAGVDVATLTQKDADRLMNLHAGGQKAKAQKELQDIRLKDANARAKERLDFARQQMDQRDFEFVTKQIATGTKQAQAAVRALPALEQLFDEQLELDVKGGADFLSRAGAGALNDAEQRKFDMLYERIIAEDRKRLFGATLTGNELDTFNRISAQGPNVPMADKLEALRALMKGMQQELKAAFVPVEDKPAFLQFEARSGISHRNPLFTAFDETLRKRAEEMPRTGAGGLKEGVSNIVGQTGSFLDELFGPSPAPTRAPAPAPAPNAAPPVPTQQEVVEPERPPAAQPKKPFRRVEYQGQKGWYDTEKGIFISDEEMKKMQSGTPSSLRMPPGR